MPAEYAKVHARWTIPPALLLYAGLRRVRTTREVFRTGVLIAIAIVATIPWDSYLITHKIWSYPSTTILGPTLFSIPLEEIFFFFIQTYITASLYAVCSKPVNHVLLLPSSKAADRSKAIREAGVAALLGVFGVSMAVLQGEQGRLTYLALITGWVSPFLALLWWTASTHLLALPYHALWPPIVLPTVYLWICDACALQRGTWVIESGTKLGWSLYGLEIEEAVFFLLTNVLVVCGVVAVDYTFAVHDILSLAPPSDLFPSRGQSPTPSSVLRCIFLPHSDLPHPQLNALRDAARVVRAKSKSFWIASMTFEGGLKQDLLSLYAWCRVTDDLIDDAKDEASAQSSLNAMRKFVSDQRSAAHTPPDVSPFPSHARSIFHLLSSISLPSAPLSELLDGFSFDLTSFPSSSSSSEPSIPDDAALLLYASQVASSVAELCVHLVWRHYPDHRPIAAAERDGIVASARTMGQALQLVNIVRDVEADAKIGRCYLPGRGIRDLEKLETVREERFRLLAMARRLATESEGAIGKLPREVRGPMMAACKVYMGIGEEVERRLRAGLDEGRAKVGKWGRVRMAWEAMGSV